MSSEAQRAKFHENVDALARAAYEAYLTDVGTMPGATLEWPQLTDAYKQTWVIVASAVVGAL